MYPQWVRGQNLCWNASAEFALCLGALFFLPLMSACKRTAPWVSLLHSAYEEFNTILPTAQSSVVKLFSQIIKWDFSFISTSGWLYVLFCFSLCVNISVMRWLESVNRLFSHNHGNTEQYSEEEGRLISLGKWSVWKMVRNGFFTYALSQHNILLFVLCMQLLFY